MAEWSSGKTWANDYCGGDPSQQVKYDFGLHHDINTFKII